MYGLESCFCELKRHIHQFKCPFNEKIGAWTIKYVILQYD